MLSQTSYTIEDIVVAPLLNRVCRDQKESPVARKLEIKRNNLIYTHFCVEISPFQFGTLYKINVNRFSSLHLRSTDSHVTLAPF